MHKIINGINVPNIPWQEKNENSINSPLWRYSGNPIINRNPSDNIARIFNSAAIAYNGKFIAAVRAEYTDGIPRTHIAESKDGINWNIGKEPIYITDNNGEHIVPLYAYDPRLVKIEDTYYIIWCQDFYGAAIGMASTKDFKTFKKVENPFLPFNRNAVLFPRKINGYYAMLSRPSDSGHTPFGDIFISYSPDMEFWGRHRHVMSKNGNWWENLKIGGGAAPIETDVGWLMFYHGVTGTCNGFVYSIGGAILDRDEPSKVLYRSKTYLLTPEKDYETNGFVPNVCFPCSCIADSETGRIAIYYGSADTYVSLCFTDVNSVVEYIINNSSTTETDTEEGKR